MTTRPPIPGALQTTARWTAAVRAGEHRRADGLLADPWAEVLAGPEGMAWLADRPPESVVAIAIRARFFDDWLGSLEPEPARQVVLLGAGLDTRAWRLGWPPGTTLWELDRPEVLDAKQALMEAGGAVPRCARIAVPSDLAGPWPSDLVAAGLDRDRPAVFLAEGVLFYLPAIVMAGVLDGIDALAAAGSRLGFDIPNAAVLGSPYTKAWLDMQAAAGAPWLSSMEDPVAVLATRGWTASITQPGEPGASHDRWTLPVIPAAMTALPHTWYVTAERR